jgi:hypothetical protein
MTDQKHLEAVEYLNCMGTITKNGESCACENKSRIAMTKSAFSKNKKKKTKTRKRSFHQIIRLKFKEEARKRATF